MKDLWGMLVPDANNDPEPTPFLWKKHPQLFTQNQLGVFRHKGDELRFREKTTHTQGLVAKIEWIPVKNNLGYTGIYKTGSDHAIIRFSEGANLHRLSKGLLPSLAIKFLIDGGEAVNVFGMNNFTGSESWDFFRNELKSRVEPLRKTRKAHECEIETLNKKLIEGSKRPFVTALSPVARFTPNGNEIPKA